MASNERMADGTTRPGPEHAPPGSRPFSSEIPKNPFGPEAPKNNNYPPGTEFTKHGRPIFRVAGGEDDPPTGSAPEGGVEDVTPESPSDINRGNRQREEFRRSRDAEKGFPEEEVRDYTQNVANEGREQSFYNIYQELEHYKQYRQFGKLRQRVNNILATLDIDEAGEAPGVGELLQYMNVVFAEPQYEAFRSEISNWIEARQITHNVAFAAKYLKCEQWGSGISNIRGRHLKALMRDSGVQQASNLLEGSNDDENPPTGARGHYYRVKDEGIGSDVYYDPVKGKVDKLSELGKDAQERLKDQKSLIQKIVDGDPLSDKEKKASWTLRQKIKLIDKMWDDFGVDKNGEPKDFLGMTDVFKLAGLFGKEGLTGFPDRSVFYSDEGVFKEYEYKQALKNFYANTDMEEAQKKIDKAKKEFKPLMIYGMNYMITSDQLDKYHSAHRALNRIKQDGEEGDTQKKELFTDINGKKIVSKAVTDYLAFSEDTESKFAEQLEKLVTQTVNVDVNQRIGSENAERLTNGQPVYTEAEQKEREKKLSAELTPETIKQLKEKHGKEIDQEKAKYIISKNLKKEDITNVNVEELSDVHLEDIEQVFGHLNRAFVVAEKIHHASGQSADFDGLIWKQGVEIPEELRGSMEQYGYENRSGGAVIFDPVIEWYDDETRKTDPETGKNKMFSGNKITLHLVADMMPIDEVNDSDEVKKRKRIAKQLARERSGQLAKAWADHQRMVYEKYAHLIDFNASIGGRGARDKKKLHHKPADYWNDGELNPGHFAELRQYGYVNTVTIQQFFELGTNAQLAEEWDRFFNRIKYNTSRWNAMEKVQGMFDKGGPRLLYDFHAMETPDQIIKTLGEFFKASMALTEFDDHGNHDATEVNEFIGSLARGIFEFRTKHSQKYDFENLNWNQLDLLSRKLTLSHMVAHHESERLNREYLGNDLYQFMRDLYEKTSKKGFFTGFIEEILKQLAATMQAFTKG